MHFPLKLSHLAACVERKLAAPRCFFAPRRRRRRSHFPHAKVTLFTDKSAYFQAALRADRHFRAHLDAMCVRKKLQLCKQENAG
jgi:hypothetical protein